ncbi:MAG: DEAD/DEAH box helicase [Spirochaetaceae bacterium]
MNFADLDLHQDLRRGIDGMGFVTCTPVQERTFEHTLGGRDVTVQSQTGTGKTAAFLITIFELLSRDERFQGRQAYIVAPTRELSVQIEREARRLGAHMPYRIANFYGGVGYGPQEKALAEGVDIIIGTPGRLLDFHRSKKLPFDNIGIVVIDEADRLFDMGFYPDIRRMMRDMPPREERMTMLFSATLTVKVRNIAWQYMNDPVEIDIEPEHVTVDTVEQELYHVAREEKLSLVLGLLRRYRPESGLIFTNTKQAAEEVALRLQYNDFSAQYIIGDLPQRKRMKLIDGMKEGSLRFLVATDVAARGLHVEDLDIVVNYDIPEDPENYVHRIGRTARAGRKGRAVSLACERYVYGLEAIEKLIGMKIPVGSVGDEDFAYDHSAGMPLGQVRKKLGVKRDRVPVAHASGSSRSAGSKAARSGKGSRDSKSSRGTRESTGSPRGERSSHDRGPHHKDKQHPQAHHKPSRRTHHQPKPSGTTSVEERLEYYRRKYGEDFELTDSSSGSAKEQESQPEGERSASPGERRGKASRGTGWRRIGRLFGRGQKPEG